MKKGIFLLLLALTMFFSIPICFADNPIVQTSFTADPAPMVYQDRLYLYTSHDEDVTVNNFYTMNDWHLYSTVDMVNWTDHGTPASLKTFSWSTDNAWAPQCVPRDGKFFLYVPINNNTGAKIGVAVSDNPISGFKDAIGREIAQSGSMAIDPTVFIDNDGQAYLFWGNGNLRMVRLNSNMISTTGSVTSNIPMQGFTEGPWFYRRGSLYYLVYAGSGEKISYATSNAPTGPWTYKGDVFGNPSIGTNHPGVVDYMGHSYFFYHNGALSGNNSFKRSVCVEEFTYGADGSIPKLTMTTTGVSQIGSLDPFVQVEAETICWASGVKTETCNEGGMDVCNIENGDYIKVKGVDFGTSGAQTFDARVASNTSGGNIELRLDSTSGTLMGTCAVSGTGGWQTWTTKSCTVTGATGKHDLYLRFTGGSGSLFNFNWWKFAEGGTPGPTAVPTAVPTLGPTPVPGSVSIACGSSSAVGDFQPDQYYSGGSTYNNTNTIDVSGITNPPPAALFNNERYGAMSYTIPGFTSGSSYNVTLYFAETYLTSSGSRLFNVSINGTAALSNFDIYATAGAQNKAIAQSFTVAADGSGQIVIQFTAITENPKINGISIQPGASPTAVPTSVPTAAPTAAPTAEPVSLGDVNGSGTVDIVDALLIAQYYVGLNPAGFVAANADVNCTGTIDIVDALLVAQYYVGLIPDLGC
jgi:arabinoxylan arabinofuranohydrolase